MFCPCCGEDLSDVPLNYDADDSDAAVLVCPTCLVDIELDRDDYRSAWTLSAELPLAREDDDYDEDDEDESDYDEGI